jgi:hypothetical protein
VCVKWLANGTISLYPRFAMPKQVAKSARPKSKSTPKKKSAMPKRSRIVVSAPVAKMTRLSQKPPQFRQSSKSDGSVVLKHSEYVADIVVPAGGAGGPFALAASIPINPSNDQAFPYVSQIADRFETYTIKRLRVRFEPFLATASQGCVMFMTDFDAGDPAPLSKAEMMNSHLASRTPVWASHSIELDARDLQKIPKRFTLNKAPTSTSDSRLSNVGTLFIALSSCTGAAASGIGELWFDYTIEFQTPQMPVLNEQAVGSYTGAAAANYTPFLNGANLLALGQNTAIAQIVSGVGLNLPEAGKYLVSAAIDSAGTAATAVAPNIGVLSASGITTAGANDATAGVPSYAVAGGGGQYLSNSIITVPKSDYTPYPNSLNTISMTFATALASDAITALRLAVSRIGGSGV